ncbi:MAG: EscS/YscS/HrcS family type III secretion system export apparatus protein [Phycisphaerae bacterium]|nr:EscS/YscS/HrcS family type III secretion system export apparatus protein [Phycisphaerae bacterium]
MNYDESSVYLVRDTLILALLIVGPILLVGILVGLVISLAQSVTSIQDQTLSFVPKIVVMILVTALLLPWIAMKLVDYAYEAFRLF